jgi:hypothetical protein
MSCGFAAAQDQTPANVGRLCNASVYASGDDDGPFYGARNAFDSGQNVVKGIHYSSWVPGRQSAWIRIRFHQYTGPRTVEAVTIRAEDTQYLPETMQLTIVLENGQEQKFPVVSISQVVTTYDLRAAVRNVASARIDFQGKIYFRIEEIEFLGQPSQYCHKAEQTPFYDEEYKNQLADATRPKITAGDVHRDPEISTGLRTMETLRTQIDSTQNAEEKARAWLKLNRSADLLAKRMSDLQPIANDSGRTVPTAGLTRIGEKAKTLGIDVSWCEIGAGWSADPTGYVNYLELWPTGPNADEAFWKSQVEPSGCGDFEGSVEEYQHGIELYRGFIERFPASSFVEQAKSQLKGYEEGMQLEKKRQQNPTQIDHKSAQ